MKKLIILCLISLLSIPGFSQKIDRKTMYAYSDATEFRIFGMTKQRKVDRGQGNFVELIVAEKGERFVTIVFDFKNNSKETQIIDFENIFIKDNNGNLHYVDFFLVAGIRFTKKSFQYELKGNKKRKLIAQFFPPLPKDERIDTLVMNGNTITLEYN